MIGATPLGQLFIPQASTETGLREIAQLVTDRLDPLGRARLGSVNHRCYELAAGKPLVPLSGKRDRYAIIHTLRRQDAEAITGQTGLPIPFPKGKSHLGIVTSWTDRSTDKFCLGKGGFGVFCIAFALKESRYLGVKITMGSEEVDAELAIHQALSGTPHLMESLDHCRVQYADGRIVLYQFMELAGLGSLSRLRRSLAALEDPALREQLLYHIARHLLEGVEAMHQRNFAHLDLKPDNVVIGERGSPLIIDFGCSKQNPTGKVNALYAEGDFNYFSPERWQGTNVDDPDLALCDAAKVDAWAAGMTLLELVCPEPHVLPMSDVEELFELPFEALSGHLREELRGLESARRIQLLEALVAGRVNREDPQLAQFLAMVRGLLTFDAKKRSSVTQALAHPWFTDMAQRAEGARVRLVEMVQSLPQVEPPKTVAFGAHRHAHVLSPQQKPFPHFANHVTRTSLEASVRGDLLSDRALTILQGAPGTGKTELATRLFHDGEVQSKYGLALWFRGADRASQIELQYLTLAQELGMADDRSKFSDVFPLLKRYLGTRDQPWLIVFDNGDDRKLLEPYIPDGGHVLVTTRSNEWKDAIEVGPLTQEEGRRLVHRLLRKLEPDAEQLCDELAYLPLAIVQACAFIRNQRFNIADYLRLFERSPTLLGREEKQDGFRKLPYSVTQMYALTFAELRKGDALALLHCIACLGPDQIPEGVVADLASRSKGGSGAQQLLIDYALLQPSSPGSYSFHRLPQRVVRDGMAEAELRSSLCDSMHVLADRFCDYPTTTDRKIGNRLLLGHGEETLSLSDRLTPLENELRPAAASTMRWLVEEYVISDQPQRAKPLLERLPGLARESWTQEEAELGHCLGTVGGAWTELGDPRKSIPLLKEALAINQKGPPSEAILRHLDNLGIGLIKIGKRRNALATFSQSVQMTHKLFPDQSHPWSGTALSHLGMALEMSGRYGEAIEHLERALAISRRVMGEKSSAVANILNSIGNTFNSSGNAEKSLEYAEASYALSVEVFGADHPNTARTLNGLGNACTDLGDHQRAIELYTRALESYQRVYGERHSDVAGAHRNLGDAWKRHGEPSKAKESLERALAIFRELFGEGHPDVMKTHIKLSALQREGGNPLQSLRSLMAMMGAMSASLDTGPDGLPVRAVVEDPPQEEPPAAATPEPAAAPRRGRLRRLRQALRSRSSDDGAALP